MSTQGKSRADRPMAELVADARTVAPAIGRLGGAWMISPQAKAAAKTLGVKGWPAYIKGRGSVLGDAPADVVVAAFGFFPREVVTDGWAAPCELEVAEIQAVYAHACREWSREHLGDFADGSRLVELLATVSDQAPVQAVPLFAGWRAAPQAVDTAGRLGQLLHELRELRGGLHLVAVLASGLAPVEAIATGPGGAANATFFGWQPADIPTPEVIAAIGGQRARAEDLTDEMMAPIWAVLDAERRVEVIRLLGQASAHADSRR